MHLVVLGLLTLATGATGGQPVAVVIQRYLPTALDASVSAFTRLFADIVHDAVLLSKDFSPQLVRRRTAMAFNQRGFSRSARRPALVGINRHNLLALIGFGHVHHLLSLWKYDKKKTCSEGAGQGVGQNFWLVLQSIKFGRLILTLNNIFNSK